MKEINLIWSLFVFSFSLILLCLVTCARLCWPHHQLNFSTLNSYNEPVRSGLFVSSTAHPFVDCCHPEHTRSDDWCTYLHVEDSGQDDSHDLKDEQRRQQHSTLQTYTQTLIYIIIQIIKTAGEKACEKLTFVNSIVCKLHSLIAFISHHRQNITLASCFESTKRWLGMCRQHQ